MTKPHITMVHYEVRLARSEDVLLGIVNFQFSNSGPDDLLRVVGSPMHFPMYGVPDDIPYGDPVWHVTMVPTLYHASRSLVYPVFVAAPHDVVRIEDVIGFKRTSVSTDPLNHEMLADRYWQTRQEHSFCVSKEKAQ